MDRGDRDDRDSGSMVMKCHIDSGEDDRFSSGARSPIPAAIRRNATWSHEEQGRDPTHDASVHRAGLFVLLDCPLEYKKGEGQANVEIVGDQNFSKLLQEEHVAKVCTDMIAPQPCRLGKIRFDCNDVVRLKPRFRRFFSVVDARRNPEFTPRTAMALQMSSEQLCSEQGLMTVTAL
ncbi:hypothetical protein pipiens_017849 [Culex pipiens pipiens]|uniref:Uncharacterized protein n=1 Tax=Culex pipiens pipiens TaxID=38569 RepID=A0ABD1CEQ6_CULPP